MRFTVLVILMLLAWAPAWGTPAKPLESPSPEPTLAPERMTVKERRERDPRIAIPKVMTMQEKAWNRGDLKAFMSGYLQADTLTYTAGGVVVKGWQTLMARYQSRYGSNRSTMGTLRFENLQITQMGSDYALCVGQWFLDPPAPSAHPVYAPPAPGQAVEPHKKPQPMDGVFSLVWLRTRDGWKIIHDHSSARVSK